MGNNDTLSIVDNTVASHKRIVFTKQPEHISHLLPNAGLVPLLLKLTFSTRLQKSIIYISLLGPWDMGVHSNLTKIKHFASKWQQDVEVVMVHPGFRARSLVALPWCRAHAC